MSEEKKEPEVQEAPPMEMAWSLSGYYAISDIKEMLDGLGVDVPDNKIFWLIQAMKIYPTGGNYKQLAGFKNPDADIVYS